MPASRADERPGRRRTLLNAPRRETVARYGSISGERTTTGTMAITDAAKSVQQLRTAIELQMVPVRSSVHIPVATLWAHFQGGDVNKGLAELEAQAQRMIDELLWWTAALKTARKA
jgi:hypothetical protein